MKKEELKYYYADAEPVEIDEATLERLRPLIGDMEAETWEPDAAVTRADAAEDIGCFFDLLRLCYAGYEYYADKVDFSGVQERLIRELPEETVTAVELKNRIYRALKPYINDTHFYFLTGDATSFQNPYCAWFTGVTVAETDDGYTVTADETGLFGIGHRFSADEVRAYYFETLPAPDGTRRYLLGVLSPEKEKTLPLAGISCPLHRCRTDLADTCGEQWKETERDGIPVVYHTRYGIDRALEHPFETMRKMGARYRNTEVLIWSLLNNCGGNSMLPQKFMEGLNDHAVWVVDGAILKNPLLDEDLKEPVKSYRTFFDDSVIDHTKATYNGRLFVLQNKGAASSGESAVKYAESAKNVCFVGSATAGCGQFGDNIRYRLPHSGMSFMMGYKVFNMDGFEEGKGIAPDYWLDSDDPVGDVAEYIKTLK